MLSCPASSISDLCPWCSQRFPSPPCCPRLVSVSSRGLCHASFSWISFCLAVLSLLMFLASYPISALHFLFFTILRILNLASQCLGTLSGASFPLLHLPILPHPRKSPLMMLFLLRIYIQLLRYLLLLSFNMIPITTKP